MKQPLTCILGTPNEETLPDIVLLSDYKSNFQKWTMW
ncbi:hypothetical protein SORBI_3003G429650 [Sorghum bicolor]|nr:hypothetical protein SORBI_3003G429650 [Sorghum bicolor]